MTRLAVFSDLDGCLLDAHSFDSRPVRPALELLAARGIPLVPVTSKTRAELRALARELVLQGPCIAESGALIAQALAPDAHCALRAPPHAQLVALAHELEHACGLRLELLSEMSAARAEQTSGLSGAALERAREREASEPLLLSAGALETLALAAQARGCGLHSGARFHLLGAAGGKGAAASDLRAQLERTAGARLWLLGLGDAPADAALLEVVDEPVLVPRPDGSIDAALAARFPSARRAPAPGPAGCAQVLSEFAARQA